MSVRLRNRVKAGLQAMNALSLPPLLVNPSLSAKLYAYRPTANEFAVLEPHPGERDADGLPIPPRELRIGEASAEWFCASGREDVESMLAILSDAGHRFEEFFRVLEFGCSSGRLIRCLHRYAADREIWGVDVASEHVIWCQQHLEPLRFATVTSAPHLPFEDRSFDFVFAGSVFSHIDDLWAAWFLELRRILKPSGLLYATVLDSDSLATVEAGQSTVPFFGMITASRAYREFKAHGGRMFTVGRSLLAYVFFDTDYLVRHLGTQFEVRAIAPKTYRGLQTGLLLRKRP